MKRFFASFITFVLAISLLASPTEASIPQRKVKRPNRKNTSTLSWVKVSPIGDVFSVALPSNPTRRRFEASNVNSARGWIYNLAEGGIIYSVLSLDYLPGWVDSDADPEESLRQVINNGDVNINFQREEKISKYSGRQYPFSTSDGDSGLMRVYLTKQRVYVLAALGTIMDSTSIKRFLDSFKIDAPTLDDFPTNTIDSRQTRLPNIFVPSTPTVRPPAATPTALPPAAPIVSSCNCNYFQDRDADVCYQPELTFVTTELEPRPYGKIQLTVELTAEGRVIVDVSSVTTEGSLPYGLTQRAIDAARQIRFCPAVRGGKKVSQKMTIYYEIK